MEIQCVKGMYRLKLVSCENNSGFKGLTPGSDFRVRAPALRYARRVAGKRVHENHMTLLT